MGATAWTEATGTQTAFNKGTLYAAAINGFAMLDMPIPVVNGQGGAAAASSWTESTVGATTFTEKAVASTAWTETNG